MFRLCFALSLFIVLGSFASAQGQCCNCRDGRDGRDGVNGKDGRNGRDGRDGQCAHGAFKFTDTAKNCSLETAGTVRYSTNTLQLCDGNAWLPLVTANQKGPEKQKGLEPNNPGKDCKDVLSSGQSPDSGLYWIDPNGGSTDDSFQAFCDMKTEGGGWTLVATQVSPGFPPISTKFSTLAAKSTNANAASHIHPAMGDWEEVMFRFDDVNNIRVIYNRTAGAPQNEKTEFDNYLMGESVSSKKDVFGFYRYSPEDNRYPAKGYATIAQLHFYKASGISEWFLGTDKWIDMWSARDHRENKYVTYDDINALGTKCIAGYCYLNKPIWLMVR